jgi:hypothetical protein
LEIDRSSSLLLCGSSAMHGLDDLYVSCASAEITGQADALPSAAMKSRRRRQMLI